MVNCIPTHLPLTWQDCKLVYWHTSGNIHRNTFSFVCCLKLFVVKKMKKHVEINGHLCNQIDFDCSEPHSAMFLHCVKYLCHLTVKYDTGKWIWTLNSIQGSLMLQQVPSLPHSFWCLLWLRAQVTVVWGSVYSVCHFAGFLFLLSNFSRHVQLNDFKTPKRVWARVHFAMRWCPI